MNNLTEENKIKLLSYNDEIDEVYKLADEVLLEKERIESLENKLKNLLSLVIQEIDNEVLSLKFKKLNSGWTNELKSGFHNRETAENRLSKWRELLLEIIGYDKTLIRLDNEDDKQNALTEGKALMKDKLGSDGFGSDSYIERSQVDFCKSWLKEWVVEQNNINTKRGSYGLKHLVENSLSNEYISNGAFIQAAIELGYKYERDGKNAYFNMSFIKIDYRLKSDNKEKNDNLKIEHTIEYTKIGSPNRTGDNVDPVIGVKDLSGEIAKIILDMHDNKGSIFGVFGKWGRGKTFLINQIIKENVILRNFCIVQFHAWKYQSSPASWAHLYEKIVDSYLDSTVTFCFKRNGKYQKNLDFLKIIKFPVRSIRIVRLNIKRLGFWSILSFLASVVIVNLASAYTWSPFNNSIDFYFIVLSTASPALLDIIKHSKAIGSKYFLRKNFIELMGSQAEIEDELKKLLVIWPLCEKKILLVVDDVDRCSEEKIIEIIDSLRVILEDDKIHNKISVLISADERILKRAIKHKYLKLFGNDLNTGQYKDDSFNINDVMREYMDKLFLCGIRLGDLTNVEKTEIVYAFTNKMIIEDDKVGNEFFNQNRGVDTIEENIGGVDNESLDKFNRSKKVDNNQLTIEEGGNIIEAVDSVDGITPRQIDIFIFRYLLARNILLKKSIKYNSSHLCGAMADYMISKSGKINENEIVDSKVEKVLEMVITY